MGMPPREAYLSPMCMSAQQQVELGVCRLLINLRCVR